MGRGRLSAWAAPAGADGDAAGGAAVLALTRAAVWQPRVAAALSAPLASARPAASSALPCDLRASCHLRSSTAGPASTSAALQSSGEQRRSADSEALLNQSSRHPAPTMLARSAMALRRTAIAPVVSSARAAISVTAATHGTESSPHPSTHRGSTFDVSSLHWSVEGAKQSEFQPHPVFDAEAIKDLTIEERPPKDVRSPARAELFAFDPLTCSANCPAPPPPHLVAWGAIGCPEALSWHA